jgi:hypothetical protein
MATHDDPELRRLADIIRAVGDAAVAAGLTVAQMQAFARALAPRLAQLNLDLPEGPEHEA